MIVRGVNEAQKWFLENHSGSVTCEQDDRTKECETYIEAESFFKEAKEVMITATAERFVRLKNGSIAVCLDTAQEPPIYRYVRKDGIHGRSKTGGGTQYVPGGNKEVWETEFKLDESDVDYELRFQPCEFAKSDKGEFVAICGIPANCGSNDYTMNRIERNGSRSHSYTISDPGLTKITKEEFEAEEERCKTAFKAQQEQNNDRDSR